MLQYAHEYDASSLEAVSATTAAAATVAADVAADLVTAAVTAAGRYPDGRNAN